MLSNIKATYKMVHSKSQFNWSLGIDNLWNENYQEIQGGFMPLRNYYINFTAVLR
jgi:outer membrane receptor protein involved in Fe transport